MVRGARLRLKIEQLHRLPADFWEEGCPTVLKIMREQDRRGNRWLRLPMFLQSEHDLSSGSTGEQKGT